MTSKDSHIQAAFVNKKAQIIAEITDHDSDTYNDKSPKGTIDTEIIDLIEEINAFEKYVTTSSCAGRVAVFVEGHKACLPSSEEHNTDDGVTVAGAGPGGKGYGNKWLFVSHESVPISTSNEDSNADDASLHTLFGLEDRNSPEQKLPGKGGRLIKLSFSPLILHILCSDLRAAKPLLAAAINAGFRESGVHSLKALDEPATGVMVGIRTAGLVFETVVGYVDESGEHERYTSCVSEDYLRMCLDAVNERFTWNVERKERLRKELRTITARSIKDQREDKDVRRERKRAEGLQRQRDTERSRESHMAEVDLSNSLD